jgi:hypothetical protein
MPRRDDGSAAPLPYECVPVPREGKIVVRFLGPVEGLITHYTAVEKKKRPVWCPGIDQCPASIHRSGSEWKGYAPCQRWRTTPHSDWVTCVFEITACGHELLKDRDLRGEMWEFARSLQKGKHKEVTSKYLTNCPGVDLPGPFSLIPCLSRLYRAADIRLGVECPYLPRQFAAPQQDIVPPGEKAANRAGRAYRRGDDPDLDRRLDERAGKRVESATDARAAILGGIGRPVPPPSSNGTHPPE